MLFLKFLQLKHSTGQLSRFLLVFIQKPFNLFDWRPCYSVQAMLVSSFVFDGGEGVGWFGLAF